MRLKTIYRQDTQLIDRIFITRGVQHVAFGIWGSDGDRGRILLYFMMKLGEIDNEPDDPSPGNEDDNDVK